MVKGLAPANVSVTYVLSSEGVPKTVKVQITNFTVNVFFKSYTFNNKPAVEYPYSGRYAPNEAE